MKINMIVIICVIFMFNIFIIPLANAMGSAPPTPTQEVAIIERMAMQTEEANLKEEYIGKVIAKISWGERPGELGVKVVEGASFGPQRLVVDDVGDIYILDTVNNRIQIFNANGKYEKAVKLNSFWLEHISNDSLPIIKGVDKSIDVDTGGNIYVLNINKNEARKIDKKGKLVRNFMVPEPKRAPSQFRIDEEGGITKAGIKIRSGLTIILESRGKEKNIGYAKILGQKGNLLKRIEINDPNAILDISFKGADGNGNLYFYITKETGETRQILTSPNTFFPSKVIGSYIYKYDKSGNLLNKTLVSRNGEWVDVDGEGNIYELKMEGDPLSSGPGSPIKSFMIIKYEKKAK